MAEPIEVTPQEHAIMTQEHATYGENPRAEQVKRMKQVITHLETAQELLARMGSVYMDFSNQQHSDYCGALFAGIEAVLDGAKTFKISM